MPDCYNSVNPLFEIVMKNFDSRSYSINDFLEWSHTDQLILNPSFQRKSVWTDNAKSYLMDTIVRGKPIPKLFIRQQLNIQTKKSVREVVDGQQRLRTIMGYLNDGFQISKKHNPEFGGLYFSQLDADTQANILNYELAVDLLVNMPDAEVLDIFGRLNSYAVLLNEQEKINSDHFGPFKLLADRLAHSNNAFWLDNGILTNQQILRMGDVAIVADLLISMIEGIRSKKQLKSYYDRYEKEFNHDTHELRTQFEDIVNLIESIFGADLRTSEFSRIHIFYTLFTTLFHMQYGLREADFPRKKITPKDYSRIAARCENIDFIFSTEDIKALDREQMQFLQDSRRATTDAKVRLRRTQFLVALLLDQ